MATAIVDLRPLPGGADAAAEQASSPPYNARKRRVELVYVPKHFAETDRGILQGLIRDYGFGILVTARSGEAPFATHLPFVLAAEEGANGTLRAHMARANPHWRALDGNTEALCIFQGPHAYISPNWYDPEVDAVPTWNYAVVHAYGVPRIVDEPAAVRAQQAELVAAYEAGMPEPWTMERRPAGYIDAMLKGIVAFEVPIARLEGKFKLNQNHPPANRKGAIAGLRRAGDPLAAAVADLMAARERGE